MRIKVVLISILVLAAVGCKKKGTGGGGWLVGEQGLMANVDSEGKLGNGYDLGLDETLNAIACRFEDEAWVVGDKGILLYTSDGGGKWDSHDLGTTTNLRAVATQDAGPVYIAGDGVFFTSVPELVTNKAEWQQLGDGATKFRSLAAAQRATTVIAASDDGGIWAVVDGRLVKRATIDGVRAVAVSPDGTMAIAAGAGLARSFDGGITWSPLATEGRYESVRIDDNGDAVAVGANGAVARIDPEGRVLLQTLGTATLRTVHVMGYAKHGYTAGDGGQTWLTHDTGWTWVAGPNVGRTVLGVDEIGDGHN